MSFTASASVVLPISNMNDQMWRSTAFHLNVNSFSVAVLITFIVLCVSCIALISASQDEVSKSSWMNFTLHPIASTGSEELNAVTHFINFSQQSNSTPQNSSHISYKDFDLENQVVILDENSSVISPTLEESQSEVTLTFGTDKPEVYLKMMFEQEKKKRTHPTCRCQHRRMISSKGTSGPTAEGFKKVSKKFMDSLASAQEDRHSHFLAY